MDLLRSLPIGLYLEQPVTWLHRLDPRVKLAWLMSFLITPVLSNPFWRLGLSLLLILLTISAAIPLRVWRQQMGWLLTLCFFIFFITCLAPDGLAVEYSNRLPAHELNFPPPAVKEEVTPNPWYNPFGWGQKKAPKQAPKIEKPVEQYNYVVFEKGRFRITRRSLDLGIRISTIFFTVIYSTNLYLLTTTPEEITAGLEDLMSPLRRFKIPVTEIALTLTLSLRFIPLVLEEVQNLVRSIRTRAINWKKLGIRKSLQVWLMVAEKLLENLLLRAEQMAVAMNIRGFTSPNKHRVVWHQLRLSWRDWLTLATLLLFWSARFVWGGMA